MNRASSRKRVLLILLGATGTEGVRRKRSRGARVGDVETWLGSVTEMDIIADIQGQAVPVGSTGIGIHEWSRATKSIQEQYDQFDGFVIVHQAETLTMAAWTLSLMIQGLGKPVVLCGSFAVPQRKMLASNANQSQKQVINGSQKANYLNALQVAVSDVPGVLVVHGSHIYLGSSVAGVLPNIRGTTIGKIDFGIRFFGKQQRRSSQRPRFMSRYEGGVAVAECVPGIDMRILATVPPGVKALFLSFPEETIDAMEQISTVRTVLPKTVLLLVFGPKNLPAQSNVCVVTAPSRLFAVLKSMWALGQSKDVQTLRRRLAL